MSDQERAPSTWWTGRGKPRQELSNDELVSRVAVILFGAAAAALLMPALLAGVLLWSVWAWRHWPGWSLLVVAVVPWPVAWLVGAPLPVGDVVGAVEWLLAERTEVAWLVVWQATLPASLSLGAVAAEAVLGWQRMRAPSWRKGTPQAARKVARRAKATTAQLSAPTVADGQVLLGVDAETGKAAGVPHPTVGGIRHTFVVGATGSGKTTTATRLATAVLDGDGTEETQGSLFVVDLKGDRSTIDTWRAVAAVRGRRFVVWTMSGATVYDPLAAGDVGQRTRKVMALSEWTEPYYEDLARQLLQLTLRTLTEAGDRPTLSRLHAVLTPDGLQQLHRRATGPAGAQLAAEAKPGAMSKGKLEALESLRTKLALLTQAEHGEQLDPDVAPGREVLDIAASMDAGDVVVVSLNEMEYGSIAGHLAEVVVTDVAAAAGGRFGRQVRPAMCWVDEFSAMKPGQLRSLLQRARGAGLAVMLSTQDVSDLDRDDPQFRGAVASNVTNVVLHRVQYPESAEWCAKLVGTQAGVQETSQVEAVSRIGEAGAAGGATGLGTIRSVEEFLVHPNDGKSVADHSAYLVRMNVPAAEGRIRKVRVVPLTEAAPAEEEGAGEVEVVTPDPVPDPEPQQWETLELPVEVEVPAERPQPAVQTDAAVRPADKDASTHADSDSVRPRLPGARW